MNSDAEKPTNLNDKEQPESKTRSRWNALWLGLLLLFTLLKGFAWSMLIFPLDAPDEPSHFNYVMQLRLYRALPVVDMTSPGALAIPPSTPQDPATRQMLDALGFWQFRGMPYESTQPPLYYIGAVSLLLGRLGEDRLTLMYAARLASVLCAVGAVWSVWWATRALWPGKPLLIWGVPLALTLHPQFTFLTASITNDAAVIFFGALILAIWASGLAAAAQDRVGVLWRWALLIGVATGLGLLAKITLVVTLPCTLLWLWWLARKQGEAPLLTVRRLILPILTAAVAGVALLGWWIVRNYQVYGEPTGTRAIFDLYHSIYWKQQGFPENQLFSNFPLDDFISRGWRSFWALYGWLTEKLTLPVEFYYLLAVLTALALVGGVRALVKWRGVWLSGFPLARRRLFWLALIALVFAFANLIFYDSLIDYQPQGRYLFVALGPFMLMFMLGMRRATPNTSINRLLFLSVPLILGLMQIASIPILFARWDEWAVMLGLK